MDEPRKQPLSPGTSIALDALRIVAAVAVVVFHVSGQWLTASPALHEALGKASHAAVVVFFVISGYVIAFTTSGNNRGLRQYAIARLSRLYSMLVPALVLTALVEMVVVQSNALLTVRYVREYAGLRYLLTAFFGNESGWLSAAPALNSPLWSLSYEFWYYTLFGLWLYGGSTRRTRVWLVLAAILAGPKILLMLPVWLFGVWAFKQPRPAFAAKYAGFFVPLFLLLAGVAVAYLPALPAAVGARPLYMSSQFATDWVVGALVACAIWGLPAGEEQARLRGVKLLRTVADLSFPLYVLHFPLVVLWRVVFGWQENNVPQMWRVLLGVVVLAGALGWLLERQRPRWIRFFSWLIKRRIKAGMVPK